jgi:hypothetical protein
MYFYIWWEPIVPTANTHFTCVPRLLEFLGLHLLWVFLFSCPISSESLTRTSLHLTFCNAVPQFILAHPNHPPYPITLSKVLFTQFTTHNRDFLKAYYDCIVEAFSRAEIFKAFELTVPNNKHCQILGPSSARQ